MAAARWALAGCLVLCPEALHAQTTRLSVLLAEEHHAATANDLAVIRAGTRSLDTDTALLSIRALGRLERPTLVPDIAAALRFELPELRAEAARAIAASFGRPGAPAPASLRTAIASALATLTTRLDAETVPDVRGAICESIGLLPYVDADQAAQGEHALVDAALHAVASGAAADRLGVARGLDAWVRFSSARKPPSDATLDALRTLFDARDAAAPRVRRLAFGALLGAAAVDEGILAHAVADADPQVRMLAMSAAARFDLRLTARAMTTTLQAGLADPVPMVRLEALHAQTVHESGSESACTLARAGTADPDVHVSLAAIDALGVCGTSPDAVAFLEHTVNDLSSTGAERGWHETAHALVALAGAAPDRAAPLVQQFRSSALWPMRFYAVKAAAVLNDRSTLEGMTHDADEGVAAEAAHQLARITGDVSEPPSPSVHSAAAAAGKTPSPSILTAADLKRLAAARARITVRGAGSFDLALLTLEAPATVLRFAHLAESGYYDGLTIGRVLPNFVVETRAPGGHASVEPDVDPFYPRDELSAWPHVRGALALSSDGREPGDAQLLIDLVDNPRFDHQYTVFAQTLNGLDVVDALLEGDVIEKIEILP